MMRTSDFYVAPSAEQMHIDENDAILVFSTKQTPVLGNEFDVWA